MIKNTFIFDMDGVIIDSEPYWRKAQIEILSKYNICINDDDCIQYTMGKRIDDIALIWSQLYSLKTNTKLLEKEIITAVIDHITKSGEAKKGLYELLNYLSKNNFNIALATSSSRSIIDAVFNKLNIAEFFQIVCSADDEKFGKPHPAIYLRVLEKFDITANECIVLEDSITGLISAKSASMETIVIPEDKTDPRFSLANITLSSMLEIIPYLENKSV